MIFDTWSAMELEGQDSCSFQGSLWNRRAGLFPEFAHGLLSRWVHLLRRWDTDRAQLNVQGDFLIFFWICIFCLFCIFCIFSIFCIFCMFWICCIFLNICIKVRSSILISNGHCIQFSTRLWHQVSTSSLVSQSVSQSVSQWVTDMGRLWLDLGPIKTRFDGRRVQHC